MSTTFVTGLFYNKLQPSHSNVEKNRDLYFQQFKLLADTEIPICVYTDTNYYKSLAGIVKNYRNVRIERIYSSVEEELETFRLCKEYEGELTLPDCRNHEKDNAFYMTLMNAKIELVYDATQKNPFKTRHFAWIDFGIFKMIHNPVFCQNKLKILSKSHYEDEFLCFPGFADKSPENMGGKRSEGSAGMVDTSFLNEIKWRFLGSFFIGDLQSITKFYRLSRHCLKEIYTLHKKIIWEVNVWDYIENNYPWDIVWYKANHDDTILDVPACIYSKCLVRSPNTKRQSLIHRKIDDILANDNSQCFFNSSSVSYCEKYRETEPEPEHYINIRCVNYHILNDGIYSISHPDGRIISRNLFCKIKLVDEADKETELFKIEDVVEILPPPIEEKNKYRMSLGMEDVRIYPTKNGIGFISTSMNYTDSCGTQMFMGEYKDEQMVNVCRLNKSDSPRTWEKNWIPLPNGRIVYEWGPYFTVGKLNATDIDVCDFETVQNIDTSNDSMLRKCKGSTLFVPLGCGRFLGVVHFNEGDAPRKYFHCLVELVYVEETGNYHVVKHSESFYFSSLGIEYCLGFRIWKNQYHFWVSKYDREPYLLCVPMENIVFI